MVDVGVFGTSCANSGGVNNRGNFLDIITDKLIEQTSVTITQLSHEGVFFQVCSLRAQLIQGTSLLKLKILNTNRSISTKTKLSTCFLGQCSALVIVRRSGIRSCSSLDRAIIGDIKGFLLNNRHGDR